MDKLAPSTYPTVSILCACSGSSNDDIHLIMRDTADVKTLADLYVCTTCSSIRCRRCLEPEIVSKYCPHCFTTMRMEQSSCGKTCFSCPICENSLVIKALNYNNDDGKLKGKVFQLNCPLGHYNYETALIETPKSLARILRHEERERNERLRFYNDLESHYLTFREVLRFQEKRSTLRQSKRQSPGKSTRPSRVEVPNLPLIELAKASMNSDMSSIQYTALEEDLSEDRVAVRRAIEREAIAESEKESAVNLFPIAQSLKIKRNLICKKCRGAVIKSDAEPRSSKFNSLELAIDIIPDIKISKLRGQNSNDKVFTQKMNCLLITFTNPVTEPSEVTISSFDRTALSRDGGETGMYAKVNLPCSSFTIGSAPEKASKLVSIVPTIATIEMTKFSSLSRTELLKRNEAIRSLSRPDDNYNNDKPLDSGINWCTIPLNVELFGDFKEKTEIKIPFFVSVKSQGHVYGFWMVSNLGEAELNG